MIRPLARDIYRFRPYPLNRELGDSKLYDLGTHLYTPDIESVLDMEPIGRPISIFEAYILRCEHATKFGFDCLNQIFGDLLRSLGYYVKIEPGDVEPVRLDV